MTQKHGRRYEHTLATEIDEETPQGVWVATVGYSGNSSIGTCDVVVTIAPSLLLARENPQLNIEAKKRQAKSGCRCSHVFSGSTDDTTGLEELQTFADHTPDWATALVVVSFTRRAPVVMRPEALLRWLADASQADFDAPDIVPTEREQRLCEALEPRLTDSNNVSMVKPETDVLKSASQVPSEGACVVGQHPTFSSADVEVLQ